MDELTRPAAPPPVPLSDATLARLPADVSVPTYDRARLTAGIVHIGLGNFHRAHQAWYLHRLMQQGLAHDWAIVGAGVRPADAAMRERLLAQDCLTTLLELAPGGVSAEVIGSMIDFVPVEPGHGALVARIAAPDIRIVSLTVTEGGYYVDPATGGLDADHADIRHDAAHPDAPRTAFGAMVAALVRRRDAGHGAFACQSCDNLQGNGGVLRRTVVSLARLSDPALADWIDAEASFPDFMVDFIAPATGPAELALVRGFGIDDAAPVTHEDFRQWVIEDDFAQGRPPWDAAGAEFVADVHAHEAMKLRILNAGHQLAANPGELLGIETIAGCMAHPAIAAFLARVQAAEIAPHVDPVPGTTPAAYAALVARRFANPRIRDTVRRVAFDGASRHPGFVHPTLRDRLAAGGGVEGLALAEALWARMCEGTREDGSAIAPNDPDWDRLHAAALAARDAPGAWLAQPLYGGLGAARPFAEAFARAMRRSARTGSRPRWPATRRAEAGPTAPPGRQKPSHGARRPGGKRPFPTGEPPMPIRPARSAALAAALLSSTALTAHAQDAAPKVTIGETTALIAEASTPGDGFEIVDGESTDIAFPFIGRMKALATVGEVDAETGMALTGWPDGNAAWLRDEETVRLGYQSESYATMSSETYGWEMASGVAFTGSHLHYIDYDRAAMADFLGNDDAAASMVRGSGHLFSTIHNVFGDEVLPRAEGGVWGNQATPEGEHVDFEEAYLLSNGDFFFQSLAAPITSPPTSTATGSGSPTTSG